MSRSDSDLTGSMLAHAAGGGGSPEHNRDGAENVRDALERVLADGGLNARDAFALAAELVAPRLDPLAGAAVLAFEKAGVEASAGLLERLASG